MLIRIQRPKHKNIQKKQYIICKSKSLTITKFYQLDLSTEAG